MKRLILCVLLLIMSSSVFAVAAQQNFEPDVIIQPSEDGRIEEFRKNGKTFLIRVTPRKGKPYYLVDADGDGSFDTRTTEFSPEMLIPSWEIFRW